MPTYPILNAIAQKDWSTATTAVNAALQQKVSAYLAQERVQVGKGLVKESVDIHPGDAVRTKMGGQTRGIVTKVEDGQVFFQIDDPYAKYGPRVLKAPLSNIIKEDAVPMTDVQRIYDETGSIAETETLCNVSQLVVNDQGEVVAYIQPDPTDEVIPMSEGAFGVTRMQVQQAFDRYMKSGYGIQQAIRNTERECGVTDLKLASDQKTVVWFTDPIASSY